MLIIRKGCNKWNNNSKKKKLISRNNLKKKGKKFNSKMKCMKKKSKNC